MAPREAKEILHLARWLGLVQGIALRGRDSYLADAVLQEAGDSLMIKIGEAANRLAHMGVEAPPGIDWSIAVANRNFVVHQYDHVSRALTWHTLVMDLAAWRIALDPLITEASELIAEVSHDE